MSIFDHLKLNIRSNFKLPGQPCVLCGSMNHHGLWCEACDIALPLIPPLHCPICALPTLQGEICGHCLEQPPRYTRTVAVFAYRHPVDRLIGQLKYHEQLSLANLFAEKIAQKIDPARIPDFIIPMPLHPAKLRSRGFNQAQLIAAPLARTLDRPLLPLACRRLRDTPSQTSLPWRERIKNVRDAFGCGTDFSGKHVALVDDVLTTGASMNELAKALHGGCEISVWVVARTVKSEM